MKLPKEDKAILDEFRRFALVKHNGKLDFLISEDQLTQLILKKNEQLDRVREEERAKLYEPAKILLAKYQSFGLTDYEKKQLDYLMALKQLTPPSDQQINN